MSAFGGKADSRELPSGCLLIARSGHQGLFRVPPRGSQIRLTFEPLPPYDLDDPLGRTQESAGRLNRLTYDQDGSNGKSRFAVFEHVVVERIGEMGLLPRCARAFVSAVGFCLMALAGWSATHASDEPPNILLVIADDMGVDASPCYPVGDQKPHMPVLEDLCRTGVVFENVWSNPQCSPTRATILTGRYGFRTGVRAAMLRMGNPGIRLDELSIQRLLDQRLDSRYAHAVIGKWHLSDWDNGGPNNPELMGVGHYSGLIKNGHDDYWKWHRTEDGETRLVEGYSTTVFTNEAIDWIGKQDKPWFL